MNKYNNNLNLPVLFKRIKSTTDKDAPQISFTFMLLEKRILTSAP